VWLKSREERLSSREDAKPRSVFREYFEALLWAGVLLLVLLAPLRSQRLWSNPLLEWLGLLSYSIYMWHLPVAWYVIPGLRRAGLLVAAGWSVAGLLAALLVAALCLALSTLTYRWVERPFLVRKARLR
jgi:peptidoglycan/LPS O-acetylase OafA/YrhL